MHSRDSTAGVAMGGSAGVRRCVAPGIEDPVLIEKACSLADRLGWAYEVSPPSDAVALVYTGDRLALRVGHGVVGVDAALREGSAVWTDFAAIEGVGGRAGASPLLKACGLGSKKRGGDRPSVLDATAGWCDDAWRLAAAGCRVTACERCLPVAALVRDGLERAAQLGGALSEIAQRITLIEDDAKHHLCAGEVSSRAGATSGGGAGVVYLDPMFPESRKAAPKNAIKALRLLTGFDVAGTESDPGADEAALFEAAWSSGCKRVVVKRGRRTPEVAGRAPDLRVRGKGHRFDVYLRG
ncbi:MAG: class I SAM-dependent methyltransferase [Planctomycetota bacterium]